MLRRVAASAAVLLTLTSCAGTSTRGVSASPKPVSPSEYTPPEYVVIYKLTGSVTSADITLQTPTGTSQQQGVDVPLTSKAGGEGLKFTGFSPGDFVYFSAQNPDEFGSLTCSIEVAGRLIAENTSSGAYSIVTCQGRA